MIFHTIKVMNNPGGHFLQAPGLLKKTQVPAFYHDPKRIEAMQRQTFPGRYATPKKQKGTCPTPD